MRHLIAKPFVILSSAMALACAVAGTAAAQQAPTNGAGLRYLSWPGKPAVAGSPALRPTPVALAGGGAMRDPVLPPLARLQAPTPSSPVASAPGATAGNAASPTRRGLTPATAWSAPATAAPAPGSPRAYPSPTPQAQPQPLQAETGTPPPLGRAEPQPVASAPSQAPSSLQASQAAPSAAAVAPVPAAVDPMAPRRDAAIFRLQRSQGVESAPADAASPDQMAAVQPQAQAQTQAQGVRYYSVHRQAGRHPDAIPAPQQTYLDALPVEMSQPPSSTDLAQPDAPPALVRDASGKMRPLPQTEPDALP